MYVLRMTDFVLQIYDLHIILILLCKYCMLSMTIPIGIKCEYYIEYITTNVLTG